MAVTSFALDALWYCRVLGSDASPRPLTGQGGYQLNIPSNKRRASLSKFGQIQRQEVNVRLACDMIGSRSVDLPPHSHFWKLTRKEISMQFPTSRLSPHKGEVYSRVLLNLSNHLLQLDSISPVTHIHSRPSPAIYGWGTWLTGSISSISFLLAQLQSQTWSLVA